VTLQSQGAGLPHQFSVRWLKFPFVTVKCLL